MNSRHGERAEWIKFGAMALVLLGAVMIVALARPLVFERIVPAIIGDFFTAPVTVPDDVQGVPFDESPAPDAVPAPLPAELPDQEELLPTAESPEDTVPSPEDVVHTVQPGENLTVIARNYGVTVDAILTYNAIHNANRITAGDQIRIPRP